MRQRKEISAQDVRGIIVSNSGRGIPEDQQGFVIKLLKNFLGDAVILIKLVNENPLTSCNCILISSDR